MASMEAIEGKTENSAEQLPPISALDKIIVAVAGPLFSFMLACLFAVVVWGVGRPGGEAERSTTIGWVDPSGPAWKSGLRPGDKIIDIDGHKVTQFAPPSEDSITWRIVSSEEPTSPSNIGAMSKRVHGLRANLQTPDEMVRAKSAPPGADFARATGDRFPGGDQQPRGVGRP